MVILQAKSNSGKTETLRNLANLFIQNYPNINEEILEGNLSEGDFIFKAEINNKIVVIISMGDNETLKNKIEMLHEKYKNIEVFYGASRTKGVTVKIVNDFSTKHNFELVTTSTYKNKEKSKSLNKLRAKELNDLLLSLY